MNIASGSLCSKSMKRTSLYSSRHAFRVENHIGQRLGSHPLWSFEQRTESDEKRNSSEQRGKKCQQLLNALLTSNRGDGIVPVTISDRLLVFGVIGGSGRERAFRNLQIVFSFSL
jgi:hypothetical protein